MKKHNQKGFTLIEVILVLAIGGLIFLLAFLAFQQVSRNRRDTQRRTDSARFAALYNDLKADNPGATPTATQWDTAIQALPAANRQHPDGDAYAAADVSATKPSPLNRNIIWLNVPSSGSPQICIGLESNASGACRNVE